MQEECNSLKMAMTKNPRKTVQFQNLPPSQGEVFFGTVAEDGDRDDDGDGGEGAAERHAEDDLPRGLGGVRIVGATLEQVRGEQAAGIMKF